MGTPSCLAGWGRGDTALLLPWSPPEPSLVLLLGAEPMHYHPHPPRPPHGYRCDSEVTEMTRAPADQNVKGHLTPSLGHRGATSRPAQPGARSPAGGDKDSDRVPASRGARQPQVVPAEAAGEEELVAARFLPAGTAGDTAPRDTHGEGPDACPRSEPRAGGRVPPGAHPAPGCSWRRAQGSTPLPSPHPPGDTPLSPQEQQARRQAVSGQDGLWPHAGAKSRCPTLPCAAPGWARPGQECPVARHCWHTATLPVRPCAGSHRPREAQPEPPRQDGHPGG